jgi:hypothetical protein
MNIAEAIQKTFATEIPQAVVSVFDNHRVELEVPDNEILTTDVVMAFKEIINQFADDLLVSIEEINDHVISATFTPILQI